MLDGRVNPLHVYYIQKECEVHTACAGDQSLYKKAKVCSRFSYEPFTFIAQRTSKEKTRKDAG
jgi:hypothetical protein